MLLQGIPGVAIYIDDILITGRNDDVHLKSLEEVLRCLEMVGLRVKRQNAYSWFLLCHIWGMLLMPKAYTHSLINSSN